MARHLSNQQLYSLPSGTKIVSDVEHDGQIQLTVEFPPAMDRVCPRCGSHDCVIKDRGRFHSVRHVPANRVPVVVSYRQRRFCCKDCAATFNEPLPFIHEKLHMTSSLVIALCNALGEMKSIPSIAQEFIVTEDAVRSVLGLIRISPPARLPKVLCIDEFKGDAGDWNPERNRYSHARYQCNITDGSARCLVDVLPDYAADSLRKYFMRYDYNERNRVEYFCCDMHNGFKNVAQECFPHAKLCIDTFHVVKRVNKGMDDIRLRVQRELTAAFRQARLDEHDDMDEAEKQALKAVYEENYAKYRTLKGSARILVTAEANKADYWGVGLSRAQERLEGVLALSPDLQEMYDRLQEFHHILANRVFGLQRADFSSWLDRCDASEVPDIRAISASLRRWRHSIENTWHYGFTNGSCEGINNKIKIFKRVSYGVHDFENFRKRLLLICGDVHFRNDPSILFPRTHDIDGE